MDPYCSLFIYFVAISLLSPTGRASAVDGADNGILGAIFDCNSRVGKEQRVAMEMAIADLNKKQNLQLALRVKCSYGDPVVAAQAARHLIVKNGVRAVVGPNSWEESSAVAEVAKPFDVPILSLSDATPPWATVHWPFFVEASASTSNQMKAAAAIIESSGWRMVTVIYEDSGSVSNVLLNHMHEAFWESGVRMSHLMALPSFASLDTLRKELEQLQGGPCRVFVVHAGLALAKSIFKVAEEMKMLEKHYMWITTDSTSSLIHSMNASVISLTMQDVIGVRRYFADTGQGFHEFNTMFMERFHQKYPEERNHEPGLFALQAYDVASAGGSAINAGRENGSRVLEGIEETDTDGLSGKINFKGRKSAPTDQFQIIYIYGRSYRVVGFWSNGRGFSKGIDSNAEYNTSIASLGHTFWPEGPWSTRRGWDPPRISNRCLQIGVPNGSLTRKFVKVEVDPSTGNLTFSGYSIEVFRKAVKNLKYPLHYDFIPYDGKYTELVKQVHAKKFDAAVGDIAIISERYEYVEFTHAHTESGLVMVVPIQKHASRAWLFLKPFTKGMWLLTGLITVYNGFVIWSIERHYCSELRSGPFLHQTGSFLWLAFGMTGERLHSNLSKMAAMVWLSMALIITQSYTASLSSMLTVSQIEPKIANIETLKSKNAYIGCSNSSFVRDYLGNVLNFNADNIKNFTSPEQYAKALRNGEISAAFLEAPVAKLFVARYCKSFTIAGRTYKVGGYGFAFPKGSPLIPDLDEALLKVFETREQGFDSSLIGSEKCLDLQGDNDTASLSVNSFTVLFVFSGGTSTVALLIYYVGRKLEVQSSSMDGHRGIWLFISMVLKKWKHRRSKLSRKVSDVESPTNGPNSAPDRGHEVDSMQSENITIRSS